MEIVESKTNGVTVVAVSGRVDAATAPALERDLLGRIGAGDRRLVVDCSQLDYISSAGLRVLLVSAKRLAEAEGTIAIAALNDPIREVFEIAGLSLILSLYPTCAAAVAAV